MRRRKRKPEGGSKAALAVIVGIVLILAVTVSMKGRALQQKDQVYAAQEQQLQERIAEEQKRTGELQEQKIYVQTKEYIEKIAKEKLSLVYPDEILFKAGD